MNNNHLMLGFSIVAISSISWINPINVTAAVLDFTGNNGNLGATETFANFQVTAYKDFVPFSTQTQGFIHQNINGIGVGDAPPFFFGNDDVEGRVGRRNFSSAVTFFGFTLIPEIPRAWEALQISTNPNHKISLSSLTFGDLPIGNFSLYVDGDSTPVLDNFFIGGLSSNIFDLSDFGIVGTSFVIQPSTVGSSFRLKELEFTKVPENNGIFGLLSLGGLLALTKKSSLK